MFRAQTYPLRLQYKVQPAWRCWEKLSLFFVFIKLANTQCSQNAEFLTVGVRTVTRRPVLSRVCVCVCVCVCMCRTSWSICPRAVRCCVFSSRWIASAQLFANCRDLRNTFCRLNAVVLLPDWYSAAARYSWLRAVLCTRRPTFICMCN